MIGGNTYTIRLKVYNECGDYDESELSFILPNPCSVAQNSPEFSLFELHSISPNPVPFNNVDLNFDLIDGEEIVIYGFQPSSNSVYGSVYQNYHSEGNNQVISLDISGWAAGYNYFIILTVNYIII